MSDHILPTAGAPRADLGPKLLLNADEAAELIGVSGHTIRELWNDGRLPYVAGVGRGRKVTRQALIDFIASQEEVAS